MNGATNTLEEKKHQYIKRISKHGCRGLFGRGSAIELYKIIQKLSTDACNGVGFLERFPKRRSNEPRRSILCDDTPIKASMHARLMGRSRKL